MEDFQIASGILQRQCFNELNLVGNAENNMAHQKLTPTAGSISLIVEVQQILLTRVIISQEG